MCVRGVFKQQGGLKSPKAGLLMTQPQQTGGLLCEGLEALCLQFERPTAGPPADTMDAPPVLINNNL